MSPSEPNRILGYYTISLAHRICEGASRGDRRLGRYEVPLFRLSRLAVALSAQRAALGAELLLLGGKRALFGRDRGRQGLLSQSMQRTKKRLPGMNAFVHCGFWMIH